ncbi:hypothetical protein HHL23_19375 [Chryseobacterium sp. RP-3-3]|uniref:Uncharacterized protein n=1 Tax=Chryseobacterium antibioticum TaxID=2728847 RepID=A0A7Y0FTL4_9FLAO|nr:hypothetical protein [Chryseobacterium antibioticum]NML71940.1 hypothetical protein [Chryseobacterium antibioticum]
MMNKSLIQELNPHKKELLPVIFAQVTENNKLVTQSLRKIEAKKYQSEIFCLKPYKDGISPPKP